MYLQKGSTKLGSYLCETGYKPDEIEVAVQKLISAKLLTSDNQGSDNILTLVSKFEKGSLLDLSHQESKIEVKAMEELKADRKMMVEAIIVKIMKADKMTSRKDLVQKTAPALKQRGFNFNSDFVERSIDRLLDK